MSGITTPAERDPSRLADVARVLGEAEEPSIPLPDRLRLLAWASAHLEDAVRVLSAARTALRGRGKGWKTVTAVEAELDRAALLQDRAAEVWRNRVRRGLNRAEIRFLDQADLDTFSRSWIRTVFERHVVDRLEVVTVPGPASRPELQDGCWLVTERLVPPAESGTLSTYPLGLVTVPAPAPDRIMALPYVGEGRPVVWLDDVIRANLDRLLQSMVPGNAHAVRLVTVSASDLVWLPDGKARDRLGETLEREGGSLRTLEYDRKTPYPVLTAVRDALGLADDRLLSVGRYPAFGDLACLADIAAKVAPDPATQAVAAV